MLNTLKTTAQWARRNALKLAQLAILAWIALELHGLGEQAAAPSVDPDDVAEIADRLDDIVEAMQPPHSSGSVDKISSLSRSRHPRRIKPPEDLQPAL